MAMKVNLDALIKREDFEVQETGNESVEKRSVQLSNLRDDFFYYALRKPDFQRETAEWEPKRVAGLIRTFINGELIPGVILWKNQGLLFVIDGAHRLSALIAWVQNDYGDGELSQKFFNHSIPHEQLEVAKRTREMVEKEFGSYQDHVDSLRDPDKFGPDIRSRALLFGSLSLQLQYVTGDWKKAEAAFIRINQQAVNIAAQELELINNRRKPLAIAARTVMRRATGHRYWSRFEEKEQTCIKELATEIHALLFEPSAFSPIKSIDLPAGGPVYSSTALRMVYDFIAICVGVPSQEDDDTGTRTIEYLKRAKRVMQLLLSNHASSLGLHPAIYYYSWTGKQQPILFLTMAALVVELDRTKRLAEFTECRGAFENFLVENRVLVSQIVRKYGAKDPTGGHLRKFYDRVLELIRKGISNDEIVKSLQNDPAYGFLQPEETSFSATVPGRFSSRVKAGIIIQELLPSAYRCPICNGYVPEQSISIDHVQRRQDGGPSVPDNAQITHPYCNTGYKEYKEHQRAIQR